MWYLKLVYFEFREHYTHIIVYKYCDKNSSKSNYKLYVHTCCWIIVLVFKMSFDELMYSLFIFPGSFHYFPVIYIVLYWPGWFSHYVPNAYLSNLLCMLSTDKLRDLSFKVLPNWLIAYVYLFLCFWNLQADFLLAWYFILLLHRSMKWQSPIMEIHSVCYTEKSKINKKRNPSGIPILNILQFIVKYRLTSVFEPFIAHLGLTG